MGCGPKFRESKALFCLKGGKHVIPCVLEQLLKDRAPHLSRLLWSELFVLKMLFICFLERGRKREREGEKQ